MTQTKLLTSNMYPCSELRAQPSPNHRGTWDCITRLKLGLQAAPLPLLTQLSICSFHIGILPYLVLLVRGEIKTFLGVVSRTAQVVKVAAIMRIHQTPNLT